MLEAHFLNVRRRLLWVDCVGGLAVGLIIVLLNDALSALYGLPRALVLSIGVTNLVYGSYSLALAVRKKRQLHLIRLLVGANLLWSLVCVGIVVAFFDNANPIGLALLLGEGLFVGGLGLLEWQSQSLLLTARTSDPL